MTGGDKLPRRARGTTSQSMPRKIVCYIGVALSFLITPNKFDLIKCCTNKRCYITVITNRATHCNFQAIRAHYHGNVSRKFIETALAQTDFVTSRTGHRAIPIAVTRDSHAMEPVRAPVRLLTLQSTITRVPTTWIKCFSPTIRAPLFFLGQANCFLH